MVDVTAIELLSDLFRFRQIVLLQQLAYKSAALIKAGMTEYEVAMMGTSELIQDLAQSYGERHILDSCIDFLNSLSG